MSCWKSAGGWAEAELLRALCSGSQPQAPVSLLQLKPGSGSGPSYLSQLLPLSQDGVPFPGTPSPHRLPACRAQAQLSAGMCLRFLSSVLQLEMSNGKVTPASSWSTGSKAGAPPGVAIASPLLLKSVWSCPMTSPGLPQFKPSDYYLQGELPNLQSIKIIQWKRCPSHQLYRSLFIPCTCTPLPRLCPRNKHLFLLEMNLFLLPTGKRSLFFLAAELNHQKPIFLSKWGGYE